MLLGLELDSLGHLARRQVGGIDDGDKPVQAEPVTREFAGRAGRFGGIPVPLKVRTDVVADLDLVNVVDALHGQAAVADEVTGSRRSTAQSPNPWSR